MLERRQNQSWVASVVKTATSWTAVLFNGQILAEAEPELIWADQTWRRVTILACLGYSYHGPKWPWSCEDPKLAPRITTTTTTTHVTEVHGGSTKSAASRGCSRGCSNQDEEKGSNVWVWKVINRSVAFLWLDVRPPAYWCLISAADGSRIRSLPASPASRCSSETWRARPTSCWAPTGCPRFWLTMRSVFAVISIIFQCEA